MLVTRLLCKLGLLLHLQLSRLAIAALAVDAGAAAQIAVVPGVGLAVLAGSVVAARTLHAFAAAGTALPDPVLPALLLLCSLGERAFLQGQALVAE